MDKFEVNNLLDYYGELLSEKQKKICDYYFREDYSLTEIAEIEGVTRSAVHDTVKRCVKDLEGYEDKLHCFASAQKRLRLYEKIRKQGDEVISALLDECIETE